MELAYRLGGLFATDSCAKSDDFTDLIKTQFPPVCLRVCCVPTTCSKTLETTFFAMNLSGTHAASRILDSINLKSVHLIFDTRTKLIKCKFKVGICHSFVMFFQP